MKSEISIKNRWTGKILFSLETENNSIKQTLVEAVKSGANLSAADLSGANLREADLSGANLSEADLSGANLRVIKDDFFAVLLYGKKEIEFLKQAMIRGKIDGSTYNGECACLSGTLVNGAVKSNGEQEQKVKELIISCRNSSRPIERFFLGIKIGDTPENSQFSKLAFEWIEEFEQLIK
jgi:hypothetical protein